MMPKSKESGRSNRETIKMIESLKSEPRAIGLSNILTVNIDSIGASFKESMKKLYSKRNFFNKKYDVVKVN